MKPFKRFPNFECKELINTDSCVILFDDPAVGADSCWIKLESLKTKTGSNLVLLRPQCLAFALENYLAKIIEKEDDVLFVFPGNGSNYPKKFSSVCEMVSGTSVFAKRLWIPGSNPEAMAGMILPDIFMNLRVKTIVVVDDVISSGKTMGKIFENNAWRFPAAKWIGASWLSQVPRGQMKSRLGGYAQIYASCILEGPKDLKVPINSLSTLLSDPEIAKSFSTRNLANPDDFMSFFFFDDTGILCH